MENPFSKLSRRSLGEVRQAAQKRRTDAEGGSVPDPHANFPNVGLESYFGPAPEEFGESAQEQRRENQGSGVRERQANLPEPGASDNLRTPVSIPTPEEFRRKAQQCRADAESFTIPELRANHLEIANQYERLAIRGEEFETRSLHTDANPLNAIALTHWFA